MVAAPGLGQSTVVCADGPRAGRSRAGFSKRYVRTVADLIGEHSRLRASRVARFLGRVVAPLFKARITTSFAAALDALTRRLTRDWRATTSSSGTPATAVVLDAALGIPFEGICDMLLPTLPRDAKRRLQGHVLAVTRAMLAFPLRLPGTRFHGGLRAQKRMMEVLRRDIASRRLSSNGSPEERGHGNLDFLQSLLLRSQQPSGSSDEAPLADDQILNNILTLIIAEQVTTTAAITWMLKYLAEDSDFQETLRSVQLELAHKEQDSPPYAATSRQHGSCIQGLKSERISQPILSAVGYVLALC